MDYRYNILIAFIINFIMGVVGYKFFEIGFFIGFLDGLLTTFVLTYNNNERH